MNLPKISKEQFDQIYASFNVSASINKEEIYEMFQFALESSQNLVDQNVFSKSFAFNPISLLLYLINEYSFYFSVNKNVTNRDESLSKIVTVALDKYVTNEHLDFRNEQYTSKYSPAISTIELFFNFMLGILKKFPQKNPRETLLVDMATKAFSISKAIINLIVTGFETEAFSTWRTLHETECILLLIHKYGEPVIKEYLKHMHYALAYRNALPTKEETDAVFVNIKDEMHKLGLKSKDMKKFIEYGWLTAIEGYNSNNQFKFNFRDGVESLAELSQYSKTYEMASEIAHSSPLLIYSRNQYYYHLTILMLYESFFRLEKVFSELYLKHIQIEEAKRYIQMRNIYYNSLQVLYKNESLIFHSLLEKNKRKASY